MVKCNKAHKRSLEDRALSIHLILQAPIFHHNSNSSRTIPANTDSLVNPSMALIHLMVQERVRCMGSNLEKWAGICTVAIHRVPTLLTGLAGLTLDQAACQASDSFTHHT